MGESLDDAVAFLKTTEFAHFLFSGIDPDTAAAGWEAVRRALAGHTTLNGVELDGATWLVTATTH